MNERAPIDGPYHSTRVAGSSAAATSISSRRSSRQWCKRSLDRIDRPGMIDASLPPCEASHCVSATNASASVSARTARWSKNHRWLIWSRIVHPGDGVAVSHCASSRPATMSSRSPCSASRSSQIARMRASLSKNRPRKSEKRPKNGRNGPRKRETEGTRPSVPGSVHRQASTDHFFLAAAFLAGAFFAAAFFAGAAFLAGAFFAAAFLAGAFLRCAPSWPERFFAAAFFAGAFFAARLLGRS